MDRWVPTRDIHYNCCTAFNDHRSSYYLLLHHLHHTPLSSYHHHLHHYTHLLLSHVHHTVPDENIITSDLLSLTFSKAKCSCASEIHASRKDFFFLGGSPLLLLLLLLPWLLLATSRPPLPALVARLLLLLVVGALAVAAATATVEPSLFVVEVEVIGSGPSCLSMAQRDIAISCSDSFLLPRDVSNWLRYYHHSVE